MYGDYDVSGTERLAKGRLVTRRLQETDWKQGMVHWKEGHGRVDGPPHHVRKGNTLARLFHVGHQDLERRERKKSVSLPMEEHDGPENHGDLVKREEFLESKDTLKHLFHQVLRGRVLRRQDVKEHGELLRGKSKKGRERVFHEQSEVLLAERIKALRTMESHVELSEDKIRRHGFWTGGKHHKKVVRPKQKMRVSSTSLEGIMVHRQMARVSATRYLYPLYSGHDRKAVIFQLPYLFMPVIPKGQLPVLTLCFNNTERNEVAGRALRLLLEFEGKCRRYVKGKEGEDVSWFKMFLDPRMPSLRLLVPDLETIPTFDFEKRSISPSILASGSHVRALIGINGIWFNSSTRRAGIDINVVQLQIMPIRASVIKEFSFLDDNAMNDDDEEEKEPEGGRESHPIFGKYFKMLMMGVPRIAVTQKLRMSGHPPEILDAVDFAGLKSYSAREDVLCALQEKREDLRTVQPQKRPKKGFFVSENDVLSALKNLRVTGKKKHT